MWITIDKKISISLMRQIYTQIKKLILSGELSSGTKLPSTRTLSTELQVSRNTVLEAYNQLLAEGFLDSRMGSGTVVAQGIHPFSYPLLSDVPQITSAPEKSVIDFRSGIPDLASIPMQEWGRIYHTLCTTLPIAVYRYQDSAGLFLLRETISKYLFRTRGIQSHANNIMIVSGSTQGLSLISRQLFTSNTTVIVEDPTHPGLTSVIANVGYTLKRIPADEKGLQTSLLQDDSTVRFVYTTPSHQYPLGSILPIQRRLDLISYASRNDCYLIEDDYDSEFRYVGQPIHSLYELNPSKVIYLGSFSKILAPALRLGYMILPDELLAGYKHIKLYSDVHTDILSQYTLSQFISSGGLEKHIWKMKKLYTKKRYHLIQSLKEQFGNTFTVLGHAAGLHILVRFHSIIFDDDLLQKIKLKNIKIYALCDYTFLCDVPNAHDFKHCIILGYGHLEMKEISQGIQALASILLPLSSV